MKFDRNKLINRVVTTLERVKEPDFETKQKAWLRDLPADELVSVMYLADKEASRRREERDQQTEERLKAKEPNDA